MDRQFTTAEATREVGATYRQLDHWCRQGWIPGMPTESGSGSVRYWTEEMIERAKWLALASDSFIKSNMGRGKPVADLPALADFVRRAAEAGVKP